MFLLCIKKNVKNMCVWGRVFQGSKEYLTYNAMRCVIMATEEINGWVLTTSENSYDVRISTDKC